MHALDFSRCVTRRLLLYSKPYINQGLYAGAICSIIINIYDLKMPGLDEYNIERLSQINSAVGICL